MAYRSLVLIPLIQIIVSCYFISLANAATAQSVPSTTQVAQEITAAQNWLLAQQQPNGALLPGTQFSLGITALGVHALCSPPLSLPANDPRIQKSLNYIKSFHRADGGFYQLDEGLGSYGTALVLLAFNAADIQEPALIKGAQNYLFGIQNNDPTSICVGGIGYGPEGPGQEDLHNTATAIVALRASGIAASDPRLQQALRFVEACQNISHLNSDKASTNNIIAAQNKSEEIPRPERPWVNGDGGAVYSPTESKAGGDWNPRAMPGEPQLRLHSYGSMTHALIESYLALDVDAKDDRVQAALSWIRENYSFSVNPGMPDDTAHDGLFYFYATAAKTFDLVQQQPFTLKNGQLVDWRTDLFSAISQNAHHAENGGHYWINRSPRWGEAVPHLVTCYVIQSLKRLHHHL